ncbi:unnamed protein product, partial [marine sediment metagenome]
HVKIFKDGVLLQTIEIAGAELDGGAFISHDGQFIIVYDKADYRFYCYKGS